MTTVTASDASEKIAERAQSYSDRSPSKVLTTSLPLGKRDGPDLILTYGPEVEQREEIFDENAFEFTGIQTNPIRFVDLGFGAPEAGENPNRAVFREA